MRYPNSIDQFLPQRIDSIITQLQTIPIWFGEDSYLAELILEDLSQFAAIRDQVQMLLCTLPLHPWAKLVWYQNFTEFLIQAIRRCIHCLNHLNLFLKKHPLQGYRFSPQFLLELAYFVSTGNQLLQRSPA